MRILTFTCAVLLVSTTAFADVVVPIEAVSSRVVVRAAPTSESADPGSRFPGDPVELLGSVPNWYRVRLANGIEGFVSKRWTDVIAAEATTFTIDVVDVGTGLGVLVRGEDFTLIYDGGSNDDLARGDDKRMFAYLRAVAPELTTIDHIVLSHTHRDHVELLPDLVAEYDVRHVWDSGRLNDICGYRAFLDAVLDEPDVEYHSAMQDFGTREYAFEAKLCYGENLPPAVLEIPHASRITEFPVALGQGAAMTFLYADGAPHTSPNENSVAVRLDVGGTRILFMVDAEAGGRQPPSTPPSPGSIEGALLACCTTELAADILIVGHHGSRTSSRQAFLDAVDADTFIVSSGPMRYGSVILPDADVIAELESRGEVFRTDLDDEACRVNPAKIGPDAEDKAGGCDNIRIIISSTGRRRSSTGSKATIRTIRAT